MTLCNDIDTNVLSSSICFSKGYQGRPFFHESTAMNGMRIEYSKEISLLPPSNTGCYFDIFYEGTNHEDTIYLLPKREAYSRNKMWEMRTLVSSESHIRQDHYVVTKALYNETGKGKELISQ